MVAKSKSSKPSSGNTLQELSIKESKRRKKKSELLIKTKLKGKLNLLKQLLLLKMMKSHNLKRTMKLQD